MDYMDEKFADMLTVGGKTNSLGRANEVLELVLYDKSRLDELYSCIFDDNAWVRMRAIDTFEKICRDHPDWIVPYLERFPTELAVSNQPSVQWHLAQLYRELPLNDEQQAFAISWLKQRIATIEVDWIVSANVMDTLVYFVEQGAVLKAEVEQLIKVQLKHRSKAVIKRATKLLAILQTILE